MFSSISNDEIKATGGNKKINNCTNVYSELLTAFLELYDKTTNRNVPIRRIGVNFANVIETENVQLSLFTNQDKTNKEKKLELAMLKIRNEMGKNAIIRGMDLEEGETTILRNKLVGGHNAGQ